MKYRVRTKDGGQLDFESFGQVEQAWLLGLVEPEDEVLQEGTTTWRRADSIPLLRSARRSSEQVWRGTWFAWMLIGTLGATVALSLMSQSSWELRIAGLIIAVGITSVMVHVTTRAWRRRKPHGH